MRRLNFAWVGIAAATLGALALAVVNSDASSSVFLRLALGLFLVSGPGFLLGHIPKGKRPLKVVALLLMHAGFMVLTPLPNGFVVALVSGLSVAFYNGGTIPLLRRQHRRSAMIAAIAAAAVFPIAGLLTGLE